MLKRSFIMNLHARNFQTECCMLPGSVTYSPYIYIPQGTQWPSHKMDTMGQCSNLYTWSPLLWDIACHPLWAHNTGPLWVMHRAHFLNSKVSLEWHWDLFPSSRTHEHTCHSYAYLSPGTRLSFQCFLLIEISFLIVYFLQYFFRVSECGLLECLKL